MRKPRGGPLADAYQFDEELHVCLGRNSDFRVAFGPVCHVPGRHDAAALVRAHALDPNVPSLEFRRVAKHHAVGHAACVEARGEHLGIVHKFSDVMNPDAVARGRKLARTPLGLESGVHGKVMELNDKDNTCIIETLAGKLKIERSAISLELSSKLNLPPSKK